jgi:hypothetical protein
MPVTKPDIGVSMSPGAMAHTALPGQDIRSKLPRSLDDIAYRTDAHLGDPGKQPVFLDLLLSYLPLPDASTEQIRERWQRLPLRLDIDAPFCRRCLRLLLIFFTAVGSGVIGTKNSNFVDVQYLMYLPFCDRFASGDHVHSALFPFVANPGQVLISPQELKAELAHMDHA